jgi:hypothetical protein
MSIETDGMFSEEEQEQTYNKLIEQNYECRLLTL